MTQGNSENKNNIMIYAGGITLAGAITIAGILISTGGYLNDVKKIPKMETQISELKTVQIETTSELKYISQDLLDIKQAVGARIRPRRDNLSGGK